MDDLLTTAQAAALMGLDVSHVARLCRADKLEHTKIGEGHHAVYYITTAQIAAYGATPAQPRRGRPRKASIR